MINIDPSTEEGNRLSKLSKNLDGGVFEYCKAAPNSKEWQAYQEQRVLSINVLKMRNLKLKQQTSIAGAVTAKTCSGKKSYPDPVIGTLKANLPLRLPTKSGIPAILKKTTKRTFRPRSKHIPISSVTWKEPVADTKLLPTGCMKVPDVPKQTQAAFREKNPTKTSTKKSKSCKWNNGKSNLSTPQSLDAIDAEYEHNSTAEVNKIGKSKNHAEGNELNSWNSSKKDSIRGMPTTTPKYKAKTTLPSDALSPTPKKGKGFFRQTLQEESSRKPIKAMEMRDAYPPSSAVFGIKHSQDFPDNNNNNVFCESTSVIPSNEINHVKASSLQSASTGKWKWPREAKVDGVHDAITYSFHRQQDLNGNNVDLCASTQKPTKKCSAENSKLLTGIEPNAEESVKENSGGGACYLRENDDDKLSEMNGENVDSKLIDEYGKELNSKTQPTRATCKKTDLLLKRKCRIGQNAGDNINQVSSFKRVPFQKENKLLKSGKETVVNHFTPPELPQIEVCHVLPGTSQWQKYWADFNQKIAEYYTRVETFSKQMDDLLVDDDGCEYQRQLKKRYQEELALRLSMGLTTRKPLLIRQPLTDTLEIGGYVIRPLGGAVSQAKVSTNDHSTFRLEIPSEKINYDLQGITIDTKLNSMTIAIPSSVKGSSFLKLVQITVPSYKKVQNLEVGGPLNNGGKIIVIGK